MEKLRLIVAIKVGVLTIIGFLGSLGGLSGKSILNPKQIISSSSATVEEKTNAYFDLVEFYLEDKRDYPQTKIHLAKVRPLVQKLNTDKAWGEYFKFEGTLAKREHANKHAVKSFLSALEFFQKAKDHESQCRIYYKIGRIFQYQSNYRKALDYYMLALDVFQRNHMKNLALEVRLYQQQGRSFLEMKEYPASLQSLQRARNLAAQAKCNSEWCDILYAIGQNYEEQKQYQQALMVLSGAQKKAHAHHLDYLEMNVLNDLSKVSLHLQHIDDAKRFAFMKRTISLKLHDLNCVNISNYLIARAFFTGNELDSASHYNAMALENALNKGRDSTERDIWILQSEIMALKGKALAALEALEKAQELESKIASSKQKLRVEYLRQEMTILKAEREAKQRINDRLQREGLIWHFLFVILALAVLISLFLLFKIRIQQKANRILIVQNEQIEEQKDQLEKLSQVKNQLFAVISHDLRSPLWAIQAVLDTLNEPDLQPEDRSRWINLLYQQTAKTSVLLENLLLWAKIQMNSYKPTNEVFKLHSILDELNENIKVIFAEKKVNIINEVHPDFTLNSDPVMIRMALRNLLTNAVKFSQEGQCVEIKADQTSENLAIHIVDHGIGMTEEQLQKALDGQLSRFGTKGEVGSGMGLSLVKQFLEKQDGKLLGQATIDQGCVFTIVLPLH